MKCAHFTCHACEDVSVTRPRTAVTVEPDECKEGHWKVVVRDGGPAGQLIGVPARGIERKDDALDLQDVVAFAFDYGATYAFNQIGAAMRDFYVRTNIHKEPEE